MQGTIKHTPQMLVHALWAELQVPKGDIQFTMKRMIVLISWHEENPGHRQSAFATN